MAMSTVLSVGGNLQMASAQRSMGAQQQEIYNEQAETRLVEGQQQMFNERLNKEYIKSRAVALAAAGGGMVSDSSNQKILNEIENEGTYRESIALYNAEKDASILRKGGVAARQEANAKASASTMGAFTNLLSSGASMATKYGGPGKNAAKPQAYDFGPYASGYR